MKTLLAVFLLSAVLLFGCGGKKNTDRTGSATVVPFVGAAQEVKCPNNLQLDGAKDPTAAVLSDACLQLKQMQEPFAVAKLGVESQDKYTAKVMVTARKIACQGDCVSEIQKTFEAYTGNDGKWLVKTNNSDWSETQASRDKRIALEKEILFKGISVKVLAKAVPLSQDLALKVPVVVTLPALSQKQQAIVVGLKVRLDSGKESEVLGNRWLGTYGGGQAQTVDFVEDPTKPGILTRERLGVSVTIVCWDLVYGFGKDALVSDCTEVDGK